ncbi:MAG TPA: O-antigen ligase family protein [Polaromonas sp.]|uniref:O-antigen ligase family protein n=1 Tax=Polaromonas sp. TaxID=1869339 RepID=UPI002D327CC4|nr:O-antigen ligase family protein [Polaromonas sp.]HYW55591.1 O-antigen ligase family protein [Polaromonas sp.]
MTALFHSRTESQPLLITWTQNTAIFAVCANLFSTALANLGFVFFLVLFCCICASTQRSHLDTRNFPVGLGLAICFYICWQVVGIGYTEASLPDAWRAVFSDRKILYILPLTMVFSGNPPKRRFLIAFLSTCAIGLVVSYMVKAPWSAALIDSVIPFKKMRAGGAPLVADNVFRSYATQSMAFAICSFLALWFAQRQTSRVMGVGLIALAAAFMTNLAFVTPGRSGYVVFLVLVAWFFIVWRGLKGLVLGVVVAGVIGLLAFNLSTSVHNRVQLGITETQNFSTVEHETSLGRRMLMARTTLDMIWEKPLLGGGTGSFKQNFSAIAAARYTGWRAIPFEDPHNQYLHIAAENGVVGLLAFLAVLALILKHCLKNKNIYGQMAAGCLVAWCVTSMFSGHFRTFPEGHLIAFIVGILMVNRPSTHQEAKK